MGGEGVLPSARARGGVGFEGAVALGASDLSVVERGFKEVLEVVRAVFRGH